ncbi:hypothetical protein DS2_04490 [Catenovulum agarivorans DS-2]|uniref:Uncharacterized protein n=1 Tax=Catenovulum agarivorans DS-2 TaxID=1328313 RepID=W7QU88_9ALTE|nr:hypothetical protein [Catenovulum agarivorans]EWH11403.1 hypothetical protein DS2_04490 [Catenovulum agarivorans DS-2]
MEVVNFRVGQRIVSFNILDILLTEKFANDQTQVPTKDISFLGVKNFMHNATPIYDLGAALNGETTLSHNKAQLKYIHQAEEILQTERITDAVKLHKCNTVLAQIQSHNQEVGEVLNQLILSLQQNTKVDFQRLTQQLVMLEELIVSSHKPVTVYTTTNGQVANAGFVVDKVEDSMHIDGQNIQKLNDLEFHTGKIDPRVRNMLKGLISNEKTSSLLLDPAAFYQEVDFAPT